MCTKKHVFVQDIYKEVKHELTIISLNWIWSALSAIQRKVIIMIENVQENQYVSIQ